MTPQCQLYFLLASGGTKAIKSTLFQSHRLADRMAGVDSLVGMPPCVPLPLDQTLLDDLVEKAKDYALMHGGTQLSRGVLHAHPNKTP